MHLGAGLSGADDDDDDDDAGASSSGASPSLGAPSSSGMLALGDHMDAVLRMSILVLRGGCGGGR